MLSEMAPLLADVGRTLLAGLMALPIGLERERAHRPAGLRTFPIVCLASCAFVVLATRTFPDSAPAQARILQGLITGIGFVGGGAILRGERDSNEGTVPGIATAASIWNTGAIGAAVGFGNIQLAIVLSLANYLVLRFIKPITGVGDQTERGRDEGEAKPDDE